MDNTHFGFEQVDKKDKEHLVREVFSSVAENYDLMNNLMSMGIHHCWKDSMMELITDYSQNFLDVAGGTGDICKRYYDKANKYNKNPIINICDINYQMLDVGRDKLIDQNIINKINFTTGNAECLPFKDMSWGYYTIAFGIRNVTNIDQALKEAYRVLKPGGKFICLEFSQPTNKYLAKIYDAYSFNIIPFIGKIVANNQHAYQYLVESIRNFPKQQQFAAMIEQAGFKNVNYINLTGGITAIHYGYRI
jgi:demethylmenaquinone methyltransferase/2-methoxy-6-polyprenyl-1,4-benzoquinol methylase/2-methoxy-6-polyprenyl-1,4-benzoquinol methylase